MTACVTVTGVHTGACPGGRCLAGCEITIPTDAGRQVWSGFQLHTQSAERATSFYHKTADK